MPNKPTEETPDLESQIIRPKAGDVKPFAKVVPDRTPAARVAGREADAVHAAVCAVIEALPAIGKDQKMGGNDGYRYRGVETIKAQLKEYAPALGVHWAPHRTKTLRDETYTTGKFNTVMRRVRLRVRWRIYGPDGSWIEAESQGEAADASDKATNKAMTAAEKVMLLSVFTIADAADPDHERPEGPAPAWGTIAQAKQQVMAAVKGAEPALAGADAKDLAADIWRRLVGIGDKRGKDDPVSQAEAEAWFAGGGMTAVLVQEAIDARADDDAADLEPDGNGVDLTETYDQSPFVEDGE